MEVGSRLESAAIVYGGLGPVLLHDQHAAQAALGIGGGGIELDASLEFRRGAGQVAAIDQGDGQVVVRPDRPACRPDRGGSAGRRLEIGPGERADCPGCNGEANKSDRPAAPGRRSRPPRRRGPRIAGCCPARPLPRDSADARARPGEDAIRRRPSGFDVQMRRRYGPRPPNCRA